MMIPRKNPMRPTMLRASAFVTGLLILGLASTPVLGDTVDRLVVQLRSAQPADRVAAAEALVEAAPQHFEQILPALRQAVRDPVAGVRLRVLQALESGAIAETDNARALVGMTPQLLERLTDTDSEIRATAARVIGSTYPYAPASAEDGLLERLADPDREVRVAALGALSRLRQASPRLVEGVLGVLAEDPEPTVRGEAARTLGALRVEDTGVVQALIGALDDPDPFVRRQSVRALGELGPSAYAAAERLHRIAMDPDVDPEIRMHAVYALRSIGAAGNEELPDPRTLVRAPDSDGR